MTYQTYVTSPCRSAGMSDFWMKNIVFVPSTRPGIPCASRPNSFPHNRSHVSIVFGFAMKCLYSRILPSSPMTEFAQRQKKVELWS
jgi:hypothetical protein